MAKNKKMTASSGKKSEKKGGATNTGASTGLKMSDEKRGDVTAQPSNKNPYPNGLS